MDSIQVWTVVGSSATVAGVFSAVMVATFTMFRRSIRSDMEGLAARVDARFARFDGRFDAIDARFEAMDAKVDNLARVTDVRLTSLEADLHLIKGHLIGQRSA